MNDDERRSGPPRSLSEIIPPELRPSTALTRRHQNALELLTAIQTQPPTEALYSQAVLAQLAFPRRRFPGRVFERHSGAAALRIEAGVLGERGRFVEQPMPFGVIPRVALFHIQTEALRNQSPVVELGRSKSAAFRKLGLDPTGSMNWRRIEAQLRALAASRLIIHWSTARLDYTVDAKPIEMSVWSTPEERQLSLMPVVIKLNETFYENLKQHAPPSDSRAIAALAHLNAPLAMDLYTWAAYRLPTADARGERIPWKPLREQFMDPGGGVHAGKNFKRRLISALDLVRQVYPRARMEPVNCGLMLYRSPPPIARNLFPISGGKR